MEDVIQIDDQWYVAADSHRADSRTQALKHGDTFAVFDRLGEIGLTGLGEQGLYDLGTRFLSKWELLIDGRRPMLLNSTMKEDNSVLVVEFTTPDIHLGDETLLAKGNLHVYRSLVVQDGTLYEHLSLTNYARDALDLSIEYRYAADYADVFEVRGARRERRGELREPEVGDASVVFAYRGLDGRLRETRLRFEAPVVDIDGKRCLSRLALEPGASRELQAVVTCRSGRSLDAVGSYAQAIQAAEQAIEAGRAQRAEIVTSNEHFNRWINRSVADLEMLTSHTAHGPYPYAGIPWFSTPFGRDGLITALQTLWVQPDLARGVLRFLAAHQASSTDESSESEPGKIVHEMREGEMPALGEVPFRKYYGTVDATPLFVILAGYFYRRTGDRSLIAEIWDNIRRAIAWIDEHGDPDGDGFVEYQRHNDSGLKQQGWKDSDDSVFHDDGSDAVGPVALSEVQGYVYEAKLLAADLAEEMGDAAWAQRQRDDAHGLREKFNRQWWIADMNTFAIALDGEKRPCKVRNSNAGHLLFSGIVERQYAPGLAATLTAPSSFNGWGVRTIAEGEARYNPMSYHNGSIWPHDTAIVAAGLARYGFRKEAAQIMSGLFDATLFMDWSRLPELFCGFPRAPGHAPTLYPVACSPQAWAAGSVFMLLHSCLGVSFSPHKPQIRFDHPVLPGYLQWVSIRNLQIGGGTVDVTLRRHPRDVGLTVDDKRGDIDVVVIA